MREGIYLNHAPKSDNDRLTGFVIHYHKGLQVTTFADCTLPFIKEHAKVRHADDAVYIVTPTHHTS